MQQFTVVDEAAAYLPLKELTTCRHCRRPGTSTVDG